MAAFHVDVGGSLALGAPAVSRRAITAAPVPTDRAGARSSAAAAIKCPLTHRTFGTQDRYNTPIAAKGRIFFAVEAA